MKNVPFMLNFYFKAIGLPLVCFFFCSLRAFAALESELCQKVQAGRYEEAMALIEEFKVKSGNCPSIIHWATPCKSAKEERGGYDEPPLLFYIVRKGNVKFTEFCLTTGGASAQLEVPGSYRFADPRMVLEEAFRPGVSGIANYPMITLLLTHGASLARYLKFNVKHNGGLVFDLWKEVPDPAFVATMIKYGYRQQRSFLMDFRKAIHSGTLPLAEALMEGLSKEAKSQLISNADKNPRSEDLDERHYPGLTRQPIFEMQVDTIHFLMQNGYVPTKNDFGAVGCLEENVRNIQFCLLWKNREFSGVRADKMRDLEKLSRELPPVYLQYHPLEKIQEELSKCGSSGLGNQALIERLLPKLMALAVSLHDPAMKRTPELQSASYFFRYFSELIYDFLENTTLLGSEACRTYISKFLSIFIAGPQDTALQMAGLLTEKSGLFFESPETILEDAVVSDPPPDSVTPPQEFESFSDLLE